MGSGTKTPAGSSKKSLTSADVEALRPAADQLIMAGNWIDEPHSPYKSLKVEDPDLREVVRRRLANLVGGQVPVIDGDEVSVKKNVLKSAKETLSRQTKAK